MSDVSQGSGKRLNLQLMKFPLTCVVGEVRVVIGFHEAESRKMRKNRISGTFSGHQGRILEMY